jgi:uncharacterized membrane protein
MPRTRRLNDSSKIADWMAGIGLNAQNDQAIQLAAIALLISTIAALAVTAASLFLSVFQI